ncbi:dnaJ homolog subfamily A member 2-like [Arctopsyche grandis]|uniref:dnaJ homolog subfamily A member 2-like n=1 Tax=Arctopsyche grandis TaxID=121162 RepID=UPI00406D9E04
MADDRLYEVLGLRRDATDADIKRNYRKLAKEFHPDKNPESGDKFKEITYAYEILSDPEKREFYNMHGVKGMQEGGYDENFMSGNLFSHIFGGGSIFGMGGMRGPGMRQRQRGEDTIHPLQVSLEDMYNGKTSKLELSKNVICKTCKGIGGKAKAIVVCKDCKGHGIRITYKMLGPGMTQQIQSRCSECHGQGSTFNEKDRCWTCKGKKVINETKIIEVHIDKGMKDSHKYCFAGEGDQQPDMQPGDVIIVLQQKSHSQFRRRGDDLFMVHTVGLTEALCGFSYIMKHLDGRDLLIKNEPGNVIKPGDIKGIKGEGMPHFKNPFEKGNLYIEFAITFPDNNFQSEETLQCLEKLFPPRPPFVMPIGDNVEEVDLSEYSDDRREEAYNNYDDELHGHGGPGLQCNQQ